MQSNPDEVTSAIVERQGWRVSTVCGVVSRVLLVIALFATVFIVVAVLSVLAGLFVPGVSLAVSGDLKAIFPLVVSVCILPTLAWTLWGITRNMSERHNPFAGMPYRGLMLLSLLYLCSAVLNFIPTNPVSIAVQVAGVIVTFGSALPSGSTISLGTIGAAIMFAVLALVFKYGALLQRISDDTV